MSGNVEIIKSDNAADTDTMDDVMGDVEPSDCDVTKPKRTWHKGKKRLAEPVSEAEAAQVQLKRIRQRLATTPLSDINAAMVLNEYKKGLNYEIVSQMGGDHCPVYTVRINIDGQVFEGSASTKKKAKLVAAEAALRALFGDVLSSPDVVTATETCVKADSQTQSAGAMHTGVHGMNPTVVLNRLRPGTTYDDVEQKLDMTGDVIPLTSSQYSVSCVVDGVTFTGCGANKKMAKASAAAHALEGVFGISCTQTNSGFPLFVGDLPPVTSNKKTGEAKQKSVALDSSQHTAPQLLCSLPGEKNPVMFLHELYRNAEYVISELPDEQGLFHASIPIEDRTFEGQGTTKKTARLASAVMAVNYLHQTGFLNMRLAEKASNKKPKAPWPPQRTQFSQENSLAGAFGQRGGRGRGRGRGRGGAGRGGALKTTFTTDGTKDASWISGGVLKAGDFLGINSAQFNANQDYSQQQLEYATDDSYTTANSSFGYGSPAFSTFNKGTPPSQAFPAYGGFKSSPGFTPASKVGSGFGRGSNVGSVMRGGRGGRGIMGQQIGEPMATVGTPSAAASVKKLMDINSMPFTTTPQSNETMKPAAATGFTKQTVNVGTKQPTAGVGTKPANDYNNVVYSGYEYSGYPDYGQSFLTGADNLQATVTGDSSNAAGFNYADYSQYYAQYDTPASYGGYGPQ